MRRSRQGSGTESLEWKCAWRLCVRITADSLFRSSGKQSCRWRLRSRYLVVSDKIRDFESKTDISLSEKNAEVVNFRYFDTCSLQITSCGKTMSARSVRMFVHSTKVHQIRSQDGQYFRRSAVKRDIHERFQHIGLVCGPMAEASRK